MNKTDADGVIFYDEDTLYSLLPTYYLYAVEGIFLSIVNLLILGAVFRYKALRQKKEYLILAGLALSDSLGGLGFLIAGIGRVVLILNGYGSYLVSQFHCFLMPWNILWVWWEQSNPYMLFIVSLDRFVAVALPTRHYTFTPRYAYILVGLACIPGIIGEVIVGTGVSHTQSLAPNRPLICYTSFAYKPFYNLFIYYQLVVVVSLSIILYVFVVIIFNIRKSQVAPAGDAALKRNMKLQRRLMITVGLSCLCTFLFYIVPIVVKIGIYTVFDENSIIRAYIVPINGILSNVNPAMNFFIYTRRHKDMRLAVKHLVQCKSLSEATLQSAITAERSTTKVKTRQEQTAA